MKRMTVCFLLIALLLTGCGAQTANSTPVDTTAGNTELRTIEEQLPVLTIRQGETVLETHIGSYNWQIDNGDGTSNAICVDAVHPLDIADSLPTLEADGQEVQLDFSDIPDSVIVWCWEKSEDDVQMLTAEGNMLQLLPGTHVYQITTTWPGTEDFTNIVHYSFRAAVPTE